MTSVRNDVDQRRRELAATVQEAVVAVDRARLLLRATGDPLAAAVDSALTCAVSLIVLQTQDTAPDIDPLRDTLGAARALVGELSFAIRDRYPPTI